MNAIRTAALALLLCATAAGAAVTDGYNPTEVLVRYQGLATAAAAGAPRVHTLRVPDGMDVDAFLARLHEDPLVAFAEPNYYIRKARTPDDPRYSTDQWPLPEISAPRAWDLTTAAGVTVAVVDTGIDYNHPDLAANSWTNPGETAGDGLDNDGDGIVDDVHGACFDSRLGDGVGCSATATGDPLDDDTADSHGTHVAGIVGAVTDNATGVAGVSWQVRLMAVKVLHGPLGLGTVADAVRGIRYAVDHGAQVINLSFTVPGHNQSLETALEYAADHDAVVVSAAGNRAWDLDISPVSPAVLSPRNNVAVAAVTDAGVRAAYSNYGPTTVSLGAPGGNAAHGVLSTISPITGNGYYGTLYGTSMAAPHVTGAAALIRAYRPSLTAGAVKARLLNGAAAGGPAMAVVISRAVLSIYDSLVVGDLPAVFDVTPNPAQPGDVITVTGANFANGPYSAAVAGSPLSVNQTLSGANRVVATVPGCMQSGELRVGGAGTGMPLTIQPVPRSVTLASDPQSAELPVDATLRVQVSPSLPGPVEAAWDFGGGQFGAFQPFQAARRHRFDSEGKQTVRVRLRDTCGATYTAATSVTVKGSNDRPCLISEAYADDHARALAALRRFRDRQLAGTRAGRVAIAGYYALSRRLHGLVADHPTLAWGLRRLLDTWVDSLPPRVDRRPAGAVIPPPAPASR